jgi:hypothetical protein
MIFAILVVIGFLFWLLATWPVAYAERVARGCFFVSAFIWALGVLR